MYHLDVLCLKSIKFLFSKKKCTSSPDSFHQRENVHKDAKWFPKRVWEGWLGNSGEEKTGAVKLIIYNMTDWYQFNWRDRCPLSYYGRFFSLLLLWRSFTTREQLKTTSMIFMLQVLCSNFFDSNSNHYQNPELPWQSKTAKKFTKTAKEIILGGRPPSKMHQE